MTDSRLATKSHRHIFNRWRMVEDADYHEGTQAVTGKPHPAWRCPCGDVSHIPAEEGRCSICTFAAREEGQHADQA